MTNTKADMLARAEKVERVAQAFDALGYTVQFWTIADAVSVYGGGAGINVSPRAFLDSLNNRAAALRATKEARR